MSFSNGSVIGIAIVAAISGFACKNDAVRLAPQSIARFWLQRNRRQTTYVSRFDEHHANDGIFGR